MQVQHARMMAARIELGVDMIDLFRLCQAAHNEEQWESLFGCMKL
jgi:hypothetical protein